MKIIHGADIQYVPASHENPLDPGVWKKVLLKKEDFVEGRIQMVNWAKLPIGKSFEPHYHEDMQEIFIIVSGKVLMKVGDEETEMIAGDIVAVPIQVVHTMKNISDNDVEYIVFGISLGKNGKTVNVS